MRICLAVCLGFALSIGAAPRPRAFFCHEQLTDAEVIEQSYVAVGGGAGTVIRLDEILILTADHVLDPNASEVNVWRESATGARMWRCEVIYRSPCEESGGYDMALLRPLDSAGLVPAKLGLDYRPRLGDTAWHVGSARGFHGNIDKTIISRVDRPAHGCRWTCVNGNAFYGSSGGGLYVLQDSSPVLIGVMTRITYLGEPGAPCMARRPSDLAAFLAAYQKEKK